MGAQIERNGRELQFPNTVQPAPTVFSARWEGEAYEVEPALTSAAMDRLLWAPEAWANV